LKPKSIKSIKLSLVHIFVIIVIVNLDFKNIATYYNWVIEASVCISSLLVILMLA